MDNSLSGAIGKSNSAVICYPLGADSKIVSEIIIEDLVKIGKRTTLISLNEYHSPQNFYMSSSYESFNVGSTSGGHSNNVIIFESAIQAVNLIGADKIKDLQKNGTWVIYMITFGIERTTIAKIHDISPNAVILTTSFADNGEKILYDEHSSVLSPLQTDAYMKIAAIAGTAGPPTDTDKLSLMRICNIQFPEQIEKVISTRQAMIRGIDLIAVRTDLLNYSPKFRSLLTFIRLNSSKRHLIVTRFDDLYGASLLEGFLTSPTYVEMRGDFVASITRKTSLMEQKRLIDAFNSPVTLTEPDENGTRFEDTSSLRPGILITSVNLIDEVKGIDHLHFLDNEYELFLPLLNNLYKYYNYYGRILPPTLTIHSHIAELNIPVPVPKNSSTIDKTMTIAENTEITNYILTWRDLLASASRINVGQLGLVVSL